MTSTPTYALTPALHALNESLWGRTPERTPVTLKTAEPVVDAHTCSYTRARCGSCQAHNRTRMADRRDYHEQVAQRAAHATFVRKYDPTNTGSITSGPNTGTPVWAVCPCTSCRFLSR